MGDPFSKLHRMLINRGLHIEIARADSTRPQVTAIEDELSGSQTRPSRIGSA
jgi:hypothetical protein